MNWTSGLPESSKSYVNENIATFCGFLWLLHFVYIYYICDDDGKCRLSISLICSLAGLFQANRTEFEKMTGYLCAGVNASLNIMAHTAYRN